MEVKSIPRLELLQVAEAVSREKSIDKEEVITAMEEAIEKAAKLLSDAKFPVILSGAGVVIGDAIEDCKKIAEKLDAPVCNGYQHNDSFPGSHPLAVGPLGYNGSKAGM